jgi:transposase
MGLCLLVYSLGEGEVRLKLAEWATSIPDQRGKPTRRLTLRWVFQSLQAVHLVLAGTKTRFIHGLGEERKHVLRFFSRECRRYYLLT